ncbi:MAG: hypothetical protein BGO95_06995 [Micrococcales bacterium 73-13]|nr:MAG: hypothetical protein BGO95_06995 [Micrococcales bacterium 73-13]
MSAETAAPMRRRRPRQHRRHVWRWVLLGILGLLLLVVLWIVARGLIARDQLTGAVPIVERVQTQIASGGDADLDATASELQARADTAAALTSDPIWRAVELVPWIGPNLTAFREAAAAVQTITDEALPPLVDLAGRIDLRDFVPKDGIVDLAPIQALQPALADAGAAVALAAEQAGAIQTAGTIPQIGEAVGQLVDVVNQADALIGGTNGLVQTLPAMLGADGPRTTLLMVQNNAELRATGGIPGAVIELRTDGGRIELGRFSSSTTMGEFAQPVLAPTDVETQLYGDRFARFMQNVTVTPDFARSGELAAAMWHEAYGQDVDAVVSIDPIVLSYLLRATGPLELADGTPLTSDNAVELLLNEVYFRFADPVAQDAFFADAAGTVFQAVTHFAGDPTAFIEAVGEGVADRRVYVWSAHPDEQAVIAGSPLAGLLPTSDGTASGFGIYLADLTMSKIDWYLDTAIAVGGAQCPEWGSHSYYEVRLTLDSAMPPGGDGVPDYVVGPAVGADARGTAVTQAYLTMPAGFRVFQTVVDGGDAAIGVVDAGDGYARYSITLVTPPQATTEVLLRIWGNVDAPSKVRLVHTPTAHRFETTTTSVACPTPDEIPTDDPGIIALADIGAASPGRGS